MNLSSMMYRMNVQNNSSTSPSGPASGSASSSSSSSHHSAPGTSHIIIQQHPGTHVITGNVNHHHKWNGAHNMGLPGGSKTNNAIGGNNSNNPSASINDVKIITAIKAEPIQEVITITATNNSRGGGGNSAVNINNIGGNNGNLSAIAAAAAAAGGPSSAGSSTSSSVNNTNSTINAPSEHMLFITKRARIDV